MKTINIRDRKNAITLLKRLSLKDYESQDIRITNMHLKDLNDQLGAIIFAKNDLYVLASTIWEITQPIGKSNKHHHFHGLTIEQLYETLLNAHNSEEVIESHDSRYVIVTSSLNETNENFVLIVEINASLTNDRNARINKLITIYPRRKK